MNDTGELLPELWNLVRLELDILDRVRFQRVCRAFNDMERGSLLPRRLLQCNEPVFPRLLFEIVKRPRLMALVEKATVIYSLPPSLQLQFCFIQRDTGERSPLSTHLSILLECPLYYQWRFEQPTRHRFLSEKRHVGREDSLLDQVRIDVPYYGIPFRKGASWHSNPEPSTKDIYLLESRL